MTRSRPAIHLEGFGRAAEPGWFRALAVIAFTVAGSVFALIAVAHLRYPGFTETMEGDILQHIERASRGEEIYLRPGAEYVPLTYMPLYYFVAAPLYRMFGDSLFGPRLLSIIAAFGSMFWVGRIGARETGSRSAGLLAAAFFAASFRVMDAAVFTVHPDALLLFWLLSGYWFWAYGTTRREDLLWLACFTMAFWTKQPGALFFGWAVVYALVFRQNSLPRWAIVLALILGGPAAYFGLGPLLGERFSFFTLRLPQRWEQLWWFSLRRTGFVLGVFAPITVCAALVYAPATLARRHWRPTPLLWLLVGALGASMYTMRISGASNNHYAVMHALLAVIFAVVSHQIGTAAEPFGLRLLLPAMTLLTTEFTFVARHEFKHHDVPEFVPFVVLAASLVCWLVDWLPKRFRSAGLSTALVVCQFAASWYDPGRYLPAAGWHEGVARFQSELASLDGLVIWIDYGNAPSDLTGTKLMRSPSWVALEDIDRQQIDRREIESDLSPWRERIRATPNLYLLSHSQLSGVPVWKSMADEFELVRDYGDEFGSVRQIADHWYGAEAPPRYLYRKK